MEERILEYLKRVPGARKRDIADELGVWVCNGLFMCTMNELLHKNLIKRKFHNDYANMEYYDTFYVVEE